jgi:hypothetical protein
MLTSDGSMDVYPENKTSQFKVMLKDPIDIGDDNWEVCLQGINYPYSWTNVGPSAKVYMKYYIDGRSGVHEIEFPDWQCESMKEVIGFLIKQVKAREDEEIEEPKVYVTLDELGRFKMSCLSSSFDVGFSPNMLKLLGLMGHEKAEILTVERFEERQKHRQFLNSIMADGILYEYNDSKKMRDIRKCETLDQLLKEVELYIDWKKINAIYADFEEVIDMRFERVHEGRWKLFDTHYADLLKRDLVFHQRSMFAVEDLMYHFKALAELEHPSLESIKGVMPGILNPVQRMYVYTNIIEPVDMNDKSVKLLKLVNTSGTRFKTTQEEFMNPLYTKVKKGKISLVEVFIANDSGDPVPFQLGTVVLTLHFRRARRR